MPLTHVFFDIGGVLGTNGWDHEQRARALQKFGIEDEDFEHRHHQVVSEFETGAMSLEEYLDVTVFYTPRLFSREDFELYMLSLSEPNPDSIEVAKDLAATGRVRLMTMNNESAVLNVYRIDHFGLREIFPTFLSSCWLGVRKPQRAFFERGLGIAQADPKSSLLIDDRDQNLAPAAALGMRTIRFTDAESLAQHLAGYGVL
ncbi:MAG TPA: HAD family phosphatase [Gemmatimonadaceae bacterium]|jgi:putative hydrolase of the HAD superfamily|nr:HAD family phosphatase [Gemmatimonadaceae bacterium]